MSDAIDSIDPTAAFFLRALAAGYRAKQARLATQVEDKKAARRREIEAAAAQHLSASDKGWQDGFALEQRERNAGKLADVLEDILAKEGILG